jgi:hypothetical protein
LNAFCSIVFHYNPSWPILSWNHFPYPSRLWQGFFCCIRQVQYLCYYCPRRLVKEVETSNNHLFSHQMQIHFFSK